MDWGCCRIEMGLKQWQQSAVSSTIYDDVIKWNHFPCCWSFVRGIQPRPMDSPHKGQRRGALIFYLICVWTNGLANNRDAGGLRRHRAHYHVTVMQRRTAPYRSQNVPRCCYKGTNIFWEPDVQHSMQISWMLTLQNTKIDFIITVLEQLLIKFIKCPDVAYNVINIFREP